MPTLSEMRAEWAAQNPDQPGVDPYADLSDRELADTIYTKHYQQVMQRDAFDERIGYSAGTGERVMRKMFGAGELDVGIVKGMKDAIGGPASPEQMKGAAAAGIFELIGGYSAAAQQEVEEYARSMAPLRTMQRTLFPQVDPVLEQTGEVLEPIAEDMFAAAADTAQVAPAGPNAGILEERMIGASRSAPVMGAAMASGVVAGPGAAAATAGAAQYGLGFAEADRVDQALKAAGKPGLSIQQKRGFAAGTAAVEGLMEYGPAKVALRAGTPILKRIFQVAGVDVPSEVATTVLQQKIGEHYDVNEPLTAEQWTKAISDTVIETALLSGPTAIVGTAKDLAQEPARRAAEAAELEAQRRAAAQADDDRFEGDLGDQMEGAFGPRPNRPPGTAGAPAGLTQEDPAAAAGIQPGSFEAEVLKTPRAQSLFGEWKRARAKIDQAMAVFNSMPKGSPEAAKFYNETILPLEERAWAIDNDELATETMGKPIAPEFRKPKPAKMKADPAYKARPTQPTETPATPPQAAAAQPAAPAPASAAPPPAAAPVAPVEATEEIERLETELRGTDRGDARFQEILAEIETLKIPEEELPPSIDMDAEVAALMARPGEREGAAERIARMQAELLEQTGPEGAAAPPDPRARPDIPVDSVEAIAARMDQAVPPTEPPAAEAPKQPGGFKITRPAFDQAKLQTDLTEARELLAAAEQARKVAAKKTTKPKQRKELLAQAAAAEDRIPSMVGSVRNRFGDEAADTFRTAVTGRRRETATMTIDLDGSPVEVTAEVGGIGFSDEGHDSVHFEFRGLPAEYSQTGYFSHFASVERDREITPEELEAAAREFLAKRKEEQAGQTRSRQAFERTEAKRKAKAEAKPAPEPEPVAKKPKVDKRGKRPRANAETMTILEYAAALGGIDSAEASKQGLDPADMRAPNLGIHRAFVKGGASFDRMAELLDEADFPVTEKIDGQERYTANKLLELLSRALAGERIYSSRNTKAFEEMEAERARQFEEIDAAASSAGTAEWQTELAARYKSELGDAQEWARELEKDEGQREYEKARKLLEDAHKDGHRDLLVQYMANVNALADRFELETVDPAAYGMTEWEVAELAGTYQVREQDLFGNELPQRREPRKATSTQTDLFAGSEADQAAHVMRMDLKRRQQEVDAKLKGDKSVPEDINNGDLFSRQIDLTDVKPAEVRKAEPVPGEIDVILPAAPKPELDARFQAIASKVGLTAYGVIDGPQKINDAMDLARIVKGILGNKPQEQFLVIVTDKDRRPLAVIRHTIGLTDQSMVEPSMALGPAFEIDGAKKIYLAHQHPSGVPDPSQADEMITGRIKLVLKGSGLEFDGHMVIGVGSDTATMFDDTGIWTRVQGITPLAPDQSQKLALLERTFEILRPPSGSPLLNPEKTAEFLERNDLHNGILFLDNRHQVVGFMHMTTEQMAKLKTDDTTSGMALVYRSIHQLNAKSMIAVTTAKRGEGLDKMTRAMQNVGALASYADTRMLDGMIRMSPKVEGGTYRENTVSLAERGTDLTHGRDLQANPLRELAKLYQKLLAKPLIDYWNNHVGWRYHPLKQLPEMNRFLNLRYRLLGKIDKVSRGIVRDVFDVFSDARGKPDEQAVFHFLTNRGVSPNVITDPAIRVKAMAVKRLFRQIGREWVRLGVLPASSVNSMADQYLPRLYLRHIMGNNAFAEFGSGRKPSKMGWRKRRSQIDQLTREIVLGEIKDPSFLAAVGLGTQLRDMHVLQFLHAISTNTNWIQPHSFVTWGGMRVTPQWLASEAERIEEQSEYYLPADKRTAERMAAAMRALARLAAGRHTAIDPALWRQLPDTPRYGHLRGAWVRKEIFDDLMGIDTILPPDASMVEQILSPSSVSGRISAWWKTTRVTLNPPTQVRNFMSNLILLHLSGVPSYRIYSGELVARVLRDRVAGGKYYRIAQKYGLFATTFSSQELANVESEWLKIQLRMRRGGVRGSLAHARAIGEAVVKHAGNAYSMIEYLAKMAKVIDAMEREGLNEQDAMLEAQKWLFDYSLVPRTLRFLRNAPIGAPFLTFLYKAAPRMAEAALMRPWTLALYTAVLPYLTAMFYGMMNGDDEEMTREDVDQIKKQMPEWAQKRGNLLFLPWKDDEGRWQFLDLGFLVPWGMFADSSKIIQSPMPLGEKVNELRKSAGLGGGPILDPLVATMTGVDPFRGTPIANESDPPSMQAAAYMTYMANVWIPPWLHGLAAGETKGHAANVLEAVTGENINYRTHEPTRTPTQATAALFGLTVVPVSEHHAPAALLRQLDYEIQQIEQRRTRAIRETTDPKEREEIKELYRLEIQRRKDRIDEVNRARDALSKRGPRTD